MPLHPQAQEVIDATRALGLPPNHAVTPQEARANAARRIRSPGPEVAAVVNRAVPGPAGAIPVRIYTPDGVGPFPVLVWYHGGISGWDGCRWPPLRRAAAGRAFRRWGRAWYSGAHQGDETLLLEVAVGGQNFGDVQPFHNIHRNAILQAVTLVGALFVPRQAAHKRIVGLLDY